MGTSSTPQACSSVAASSPSIALKAHAGVEKPSAPQGSEFTCDMASAGFGRREPVEPEPRALGRQLPRLDVVSPAGALLVAAAGDAVEQPRLARSLADERGDRALVGEFRAVVGDRLLTSLRFNNA